MQTWMHQPYLIAFMKREFFNPADNGLAMNIKESIYNLLGWQVEQPEKTQIFDEEASVLSTGERTVRQDPIINWCRTIIYSPAQFPSHPNRREITERMAAMEAKMNEQMKVMEEVRKRVLQKHQGKATPEQIEYYIGMEMQQEAQKQMQRQVAQMMEQSRQGVPLTPAQQQQRMMMERMQMMAKMQRAHYQQAQQGSHLRGVPPPAMKDPEEEVILIGADDSEKHGQSTSEPEQPPAPAAAPETIDLL